MSHDFNTNFDKLLETEFPRQETVGDKQQEHYTETGHYRNICFQWSDNRKLFLSYSYLIACEHLPDEGVIVMEFTLYTVLIRGSKLDDLFFMLMSQHIRLVTCTEERYNVIQNSGHVINEIIATKKE